MIVKPKTRGFICITAHPTGCAANVAAQVEYAKAHPVQGPKRVLVLGSSTGYGLASRIAAAFGAGASTVGVAYESPSDGKRCASAGWYNNAAFEKEAAAAGLYAKTVMGDAFSEEIKKETLDLIERDLGGVDLVIYSLAAPARLAPDGVKYRSVLKPVGEPYRSKSLDLSNGLVSTVEIEPATEEEVSATVKVMGGEDWKLWIDALRARSLLPADGVTLAYSYVGPTMTHPIYRDGSIGAAKVHLYDTARALRGEGVKAYVSINKAVVTQSSAAIPVVPLYISILFRIMKREGLHEDCIEQIIRMFGRVYGSDEVVTDSEGLIRVDDLELRPDIQAEVSDVWERVTSENIAELADVAGYQRDFLRLFGFEVEGIDYELDVEL